MNSTTPNNDGDDLKKWGDLDESCDDTEITLWGADSDSEHTNISVSRYSVRTASLERKDMNTKGLTQKGYQNSADDNQIVKGIDGDENAIGYFGYTY